MEYAADTNGGPPWMVFRQADGTTFRFQVIGPRGRRIAMVRSLVAAVHG
jgi:hypothetical protein